VRLTDLIRGVKAPADTSEKDKAEAESPAAEVAPPVPPPVQLRALKEQAQREAATLPPSPPPPMRETAAPATQRSLAVETLILTAPKEPLASPVSTKTTVLELPADPADLAAQAARLHAPSVDWYGKAEAALLEIEGMIKRQRPLSLGDLPQIAEGMAESLAVEDRLVVRAISHQSGPSLIGNMVHGAIFAVKIGMGLGYRPDELANLALAALVHDLGMLRLPGEMLEEPGRWSADQLELLHRHPQMGVELLKPAVKDRPWLAEVVMQEHERVNGTGYPKKLQGPQIHEFALVIGLADILDAMLRSRATRKALLPYEAVRLLLTREKAAFPTRLFKSLLQQFSVFPVGTWVKLTSGEIGEVVRSNTRFPLRPLIQVVIDQSGQRLREPKEMDLSGTPLVHVGEIVDALQFT